MGYIMLWGTQSVWVFGSKDRYSFLLKFIYIKRINVLWLTQAWNNVRIFKSLSKNSTRVCKFTDAFYENYQNNLDYTNKEIITEKFKCLNHKSKNWTLSSNIDKWYLYRLRTANLYPPTIHPVEDLKLCCLWFHHGNTYILK